MPRKFRVYGQQTISVSQDVELSDEQLEQLAADLGVEVDKLTLSDVHEKVMEEADDEGVPGLCVYCSGMGIGATFSRDDDQVEWNDDTENIEDAITEVTSE